MLWVGMGTGEGEGDVVAGCLQSVGEAQGDGLESVPSAAPRAGMPSGVGGGGSSSRTGAGGLDLARDHVGIPALNDDCPCVPVVDDGEVGSDLFAPTSPRGDSPGETLVLENPLGS